MRRVRLESSRRIERKRYKAKMRLLVSEITRGKRREKKPVSTRALFPCL
jgi:hypothetical protein